MLEARLPQSLWNWPYIGRIYLILAAPDFLDSESRKPVKRGGAW